MPLSKAILWVLVLGMLVAAGLFAFVPDSRPAFVKTILFRAQGFGPARTPAEALDRFREALRKRNYEAASRFCGGPYAEEFARAVKGATQLSKAADGLLYNLEEVANINAPKGRYVLHLLEPFPHDFKVQQVKQSEGGDKASAVISFEPVSTTDVYFSQPWGVDPRILLSLVPVEEADLPLVLVDYRWTVPLEADQDKVWKIHFAAPARLRDSAAFLRQNAGNYARALDKVRDSVLNDALTKAAFENSLQTALEHAR
jgi:hypothetical protein